MNKEEMEQLLELYFKRQDKEMQKLRLKIAIWCILTFGLFLTIIWKLCTTEIYLLIG